MQDAVELFDLFALDVREAGLDAAHRVRLLALDQLRHLALAPPHPLVELVQRASSLGGEAVELRCSRGDGFLRRPRDLVAQAHEPRALLLALGLEALGVRRDPCLCLGDQLLLSLCELRELIDDRVLRTFEVVRSRRGSVLRPVAGRR